jgi:general secretion pathway protein G
MAGKHFPCWWSSYRGFLVIESRLNFAQNRPRAQAALRRHRVRAFTLIEILIVVVIIGIIATMVIPQFTSASQQARENTLKEELQYMRTQVTVFKAQHQDVPPGYPAGNPQGTPDTTDFANQMTEYSDINFNLSATASAAFPYGPYLSQMPVNPFNGFATVKMVANNQSIPAADGTTGWIYMAQNQTIMANIVGNDSTGTPYVNY